MSKQSFKDPPRVEITCDTCNELYEVPGTMSFKHANEDIKAAGWICTKVDEEYKDFCCQDCKEKY